MSGPTAARSRDGRRLHLQHGPIDLIICAEGEPSAVEEAYAAAWAKFRTILDELVAELAVLRCPFDAETTRLEGTVARRMAAAVAAFPGEFVTPMAAVAGAVADDVRDVIAAAGGDGLSRAYVNNGGDIALLLTPGTTYDVGVVPVPDRPALLGKATVAAGDPVRGVATSGRHGRSHSLGIADAVTVLAHDAATADTAATLVANAIDLPGHPAVTRVAASELDPDSDLGERLVTTGVGPLRADEVAAALTAGREAARRMLAAGTIVAAVLCLQDQLAPLGSPSGPLARLATGA